MGANYNGGQRFKHNTTAATITADKLSDRTRELLANGAILGRDADKGFARLYVLPEHAEALRQALTKDCYAGVPNAVVEAKTVYPMNPETYEPYTLVMMEIPDQQAAMIANGVERTQNGERRGVANTLVLKSNGAPHDDIDLQPKAFELLANGQSLAGIGAKSAREGRPSGFGGIYGK